MIKLRDVSFFYGKNKILHNINLNIKKGEKIAIIGHNGSGKSTLIDTMIGIKTAKEGSVEYNLTSGKTFRDILGVQFQTKDFPVGLKLKHLLNFYLDVYGKKITDKDVKTELKRMHLDKRLNVPLKKLSGGQKQSFNIMTALINKPEILVVDEVLTGLDITTQASTIDLLEKHLKDDKLTFITVTHSPLELNRLVDRIIVLKSGGVILDASKKDIIKKHGSLEVFLGGLKND